MKVIEAFITDGGARIKFEMWLRIACVQNKNVFVGHMIMNHFTDQEHFIKIMHKSWDDPV